MSDFESQTSNFDVGTHRQGLGILYATPSFKRNAPKLSDHSLTNTLREQYWTDAAKQKFNSDRSWTIEAKLTHDLGRGGVNRELSDPGDDFRTTLVLSGTNVERRDEWYETTECYPIVCARAVNNFMRYTNGLGIHESFDPQHFLHSIDLRKPRRALQRKASDDVIESILQKLSKPTYAMNITEFGYATLVVGLPLWFATPPTNPLRPENAIDDFVTRIALGMKLRVMPRLHKPDCAFGRVVVVWEPSFHAINQWKVKASTSDLRGLNYIGTMADAVGSALFPIIIDALNPDDQSGCTRTLGAKTAYGSRSETEERQVQTSV